MGMIEVSIPFANFIVEWSNDDSEFMQWMYQHAGKPISKWKARSDPTKAEYAIFCFENEAIAMEFRLIWG